MNLPNSLGRIGWAAEMTRSTERSLQLIKGLHELILDKNQLELSDFAEVSASMMEGYARFVSIGVPGQTIALAMLGATVNLYDMFGMRGDLPDILRGMASRIEQESGPN
jgi:hypothetical protein